MKDDSIDPQEALKRMSELFAQPSTDADKLAQYPANEVPFFPQDGQSLYQLGLMARLENRHEDAVAFLEKAAQAEPTNVAFHNSLGSLYLDLRRFEKARLQLELGLDLAPDHKEILSNLGVTYQALNQFNRAHELFDRALAVDPNFMHAREAKDLLYKDMVPAWHFSMMNDDLRNGAYDRAICKAVKPDSLVLEIGTGSGLLAMMAARAGAKRVVTTEMVPLLAQKAREIVATNGYQQQVSVLCKKSNYLEIGVDLPEKADLLITETFDAGFLGEDAVVSVNHARKYLLKPDAVILPRGGTIFGTLLESRKLWEEGGVHEAAGFNLKPFNQFCETKSCKYVQNFPHRRLSRDFEIFDFDFMGDPITEEVKEIPLKITHGGTLHAIIYWFRLQLDEDITLETGIEDESCWMAEVKLLRDPVEMVPGKKLTLVAQHNGRWIKLRLLDESREYD